MRLLEIRTIEGTIELKTGLHIGSGGMEMQIGGTDSTVIRHPHTLQPYIPGSSLKGKVRALLELRSGLMPLTKGHPIQAKHLKSKHLNDANRKEATNIVKLFGSGSADAEDMTELGPTRASFADCGINEKWLEVARKERWLLTEVKPENRINRITAEADPRFVERVPAGTKFDFMVSIKLLGNGEDVLFDYLLEGLKLLEKDALGASGSRGYGRVCFHFRDEALKEKFKNIDPFANAEGVS